MIVAFDIDDTLWKVRRKGYHPDGRANMDQVPDYDLIQVLRWFAQNGDTVWVWSAGGVDYAKTICTKLGIDELVTVVPKGMKPWDVQPDLCFDDETVKLAKVNVRVCRNS